MIIIGITGSIGMGKTTISSMLKLLRIPIFDSDKEVKEILEKNSEAIDKILNIWPEIEIPGQKIRGINKLLLSEIVFSKIEDKKTLEKIIHPIVKVKRLKFIRKQKKSYFIGLDIPLLYETGTDKICDYIFLVNTSKKIQRERVLSRRNMTEKKFDQINKLQWSFERKKKRKPLLINTSFGKIFSFLTILIYLLGILIKKEISNDKRVSIRH